MSEIEAGGRRRRKGSRPDAGGGIRKVNYRQLRNPFPPVSVFTPDRVEAMHRTSLRVLSELGVKVLLPEARQLFVKAGALVDEESQMVRIGREIVEAAIASAPKSFVLHGAVRERDVVMELGSLTFQTGAGCPHATDLVRGRRPGTMADLGELLKLAHHFDAIHMLSPMVEPQDVPVHLRHYDMTLAQLTISDKVPFVYARGTPQSLDTFEMIRDFRGLSDEAFREGAHCFTIINTNSPRQIDIPMAQGLIDFARHGQMAIVTPFCLMGAMAPVTVAGALVLSHAEALAAITLNQLSRPGAPVCYGAFASSVDMKSGAPAFGTPEHAKANLGAGQLARHIGLPWRCAAGAATNINDAQGAHETEISAWSSVLAGATITIHSAGWVEGGLSFSYEKMITDMEMVNTFAELCTAPGAEDGDLAFEALSEVQPGGHFFGCGHTMERYQAAFYEPVVADWSNFGTWTERGALDANHRATAIWQDIVQNAPAFSYDKDRADALKAFIARRTAEGGAPPES
ncbi:MAG: trimethylamine methyltransferase family protein [Nitratireductor sp.]